MNHLSLFTGIGGLDLAAEAAGFETVGQCEWADYPRAVLEKHWPGLPRWKDIRTLTGEDFYARTGLRTVDVISGGFPCQPFSTAGKRRGKEDDRYLWPEMLRVIQEIRPRWVIGENVAGIVSLALDQVLSDLEAIGYTCQAIVIPACAVDAPHRRDRVAIVANRMCDGGETGAADSQRGQEGYANQPFYSGSPLANAERIGLWEDGDQSRIDCERDGPAQKQGWGAEPCTVGRCGGYVSNADEQGLSLTGYEPLLEEIQPENRVEFGGWWPAEPNVGRVAHGVPHQVDRLRCVGNAVVPQQFYPIFAAIAEIAEIEKGGV